MLHTSNSAMLILLWGEGLAQWIKFPFASQKLHFNRIIYESSRQVTKRQHEGTLQKLGMLVA